MLEARKIGSKIRVLSRFGFIPAIFLLASATVLAGCSAEGGFISPPSMLEPKGPLSQNIANLSWVFIGLGSLIFIGVMVYLGYALFSSRQRNIGDEMAHPDRGVGAVIIWGAGFTTLVLLLLFGLDLATMAANEAYKDDELVVDVIGRQWWWEVKYPNQRFETANEIRIPVGQSVTVRLTTNDVIHSLWVPELNGKLDTIPGQINTFTLHADQPGEFWGECAEFCGIQHAKMKLLVIAQPKEEFQQWIANQQEEPNPQLEDPLALEGQQVFIDSACVNCHTIRGTNASGDLGPDLTHVASRRTIGAGILENSPGNLAGWILDSQAIKPGNEMPPMDLSGPELQALLAYMATLK